MTTKGTIAGLVLAAAAIGGAWLALRRASPNTATVPGTGTRSSWEPSTYKPPAGSSGAGNLQDYMAWVSKTYYGSDGDPVVLDARDARAVSGAGRNTSQAFDASGNWAYL